MDARVRADVVTSARLLPVSVDYGVTSRRWLPVEHVSALDREKQRHPTDDVDGVADDGSNR